MFIIESYGTIVLFCIVTVLCRGSWANTQKLSAGNWRFELFYRNSVLSIVASVVLLAITRESAGERSFLAVRNNTTPIDSISFD
jgi:glucose uptake protein